MRKTRVVSASNIDAADRVDQSTAAQLVIPSASDGTRAGAHRPAGLDAECEPRSWGFRARSAELPTLQIPDPPDWRDDCLGLKSDPGVVAAVLDAVSAEHGKPSTAEAAVGFAATRLVASHVGRLIDTHDVTVFPTAWTALESMLHAIDRGRQCVIADATLPASLVDAATEAAHHVVPAQDISSAAVKRRVSVLRRQNLDRPLTLVVRAPFHAYRAHDHFRSLANVCRSRDVYLVADVTSYLPMLGQLAPAGLDGALTYCDAVVARLSPVFSSQASFVATRNDLVAAALQVASARLEPVRTLPLDEAAAIRTGLEILTGPHGEARRQMLERQRDSARSMLLAAGFETSIVDLARLAYTLNVNDERNFEILPLLFQHALDYTTYTTTTRTTLTPISKTRVRVDLELSYRATKEDVLAFKRVALYVRDSLGRLPEWTC